MDQIMVHGAPSPDPIQMWLYTLPSAGQTATWNPYQITDDMNQCTLCSPEFHETPSLESPEHFAASHRFAQAFIEGMGREILYVTLHATPSDTKLLFLCKFRKSKSPIANESPNLPHNEPTALEHGKLHVYSFTETHRWIAGSLHALRRLPFCGEITSSILKSAKESGQFTDKASLMAMARIGSRMNDFSTGLGELRSTHSHVQLVYAVSLGVVDGSEEYLCIIRHE